MLADTLFIGFLHASALSALCIPSAPEVQCTLHSVHSDSGASMLHSALNAVRLTLHSALSNASSECTEC